MDKGPNSAYPAYRRSELPNGVRVVTESIPSVRSIAVGAWIFTGSRDETQEEKATTEEAKEKVG